MNRRLLCLGTVGALGLFLGFPNPLLQIPPLALLYPAALYLLGRDARNKREAFRQGWLTGLAGASAALYWLALPIHNVGGLPWPLAAPCAMVIGAYVGLYGGVFCLCAQLLHGYFPLRRCLALGIVWYFLELLRGTLFTGFPWLPLAAAFAPWQFAIQGATLLGTYAVGGVFALTACLLAETLTGSTARKVCLCAALGILTMLAVFGILRLEFNSTETASTEFPVIFVEGNIDQNQKWKKSWQQHTVDLYLQLSREALTQHSGPVPLIIWPETSMPFYYQEHRIHGPSLRAFAAEAHTPLLFGAPGFIKDSRTFRLFNRAYLIDDQGNDAGLYEKERLVPFGEYLPPWLDFAFLKPLLQGVGDFIPGTSSTPLRSGDLALGMLICYEGIFPELAQARVAAGANILVNISNDGWFGDTSAPEQHLQMAALRAVEQNRWLLRGTNTGVSGIYDNLGRLVLRGTQFKAQSLSGQARSITSLSVYHRLAPWIPWTALVLLIILIPPGSTRLFKN